jgi:predicted DNA-binding transcriptional regulator YafY
VTARENLQKAVVLFDKSVVKYLQSQKFYYGFVSETPKGQQVEMTFLISFTTYLARWLLMFTDAVEIVSPPSLKEEIRHLAQSLQKHFA